MATDEGNSLHEIWTPNKNWNWNNCRKLELSTSWIHGLIPQLVRVSQRNSVIVDLNLTQLPFCFVVELFAIFKADEKLCLPDQFFSFMCSLNDNLLSGVSPRCLWFRLSLISKLLKRVVEVWFCCSFWRKELFVFA